VLLVEIGGFDAWCPKDKQNATSVVGLAQSVSSRMMTNDDGAFIILISVSELYETDTTVL
jgi:hypothetical protein